MTDHPQLQQLLDELCDSLATPEEVCASYPELLPEVRRRWAKMRRIQAELDALFPPSLIPGTSQPALPTPDAPLPEIPGYLVESVLGHGGVGIVYRAYHLRLHRPVALKMQLARARALPSDRERFEREAEAVAALHHPNIVQIYDIGDVSGHPFFTMELVEGGSLAKALQGTPQPARQAAATVFLLADAIHAAHQCGIVHRDLKPGNVLLTSDGTPKVSDFGLAWRPEAGDELTLCGMPMGTPSYMSPCQARGDKSALGPATDIWALGAILYELLTGRPPFRSDTPSATLHQIATEEPVAPRRLNPRVPRDLETICLKCLRKEPHHRYASAQALADDLRRFERGEPIKARPLMLAERAVRWVRRRPALAGAMALGALLATALVVTVVWWHGQRTALEATAVAYAEADLSESQRLIDRGEFEASAAVLERAKDRLRDFVPPELAERLATAFGTLELVTRLDAIRMGRSVVRDKDYEMDTAQADRDYEKAFRSARLGTDQEEAKVVAARVRASPACNALVAALDDWAACTRDQRRRAWLLRVARLADPDPWRDRLRDPDPKAWADRERLVELARTAPVAVESVQLLNALGWRLRNAGAPEEAVAFLGRVQQAHPNDFYANYMLGNALVQVDQFADAVGYFRAALALRPGSTIAWTNLGYTLLQLQRWDEARVASEECLRIEPANGWAHLDLGTALRRQGHTDLAIEHLQRALPLVEPSSRLHRELAFALQERQRWGEAIDHFRAAAALEPDKPWLQYDLGMALNSPGHQDEAIEQLRKTLALDPRYPEARVNLARILLELGRPDEAIVELRRAIEVDPADMLAPAELRRTLTRLGRWEEVQAAWRKDLDAGPANHDAWFGYAELCLFRGDDAEYRRACRELLTRFGSATDPTVAERVGRTCLLLPAPEEDLQQSVALIERGVAAGRSGREFAYPYCLFAEGLARYREDRFDDAIELMSGEAASVMGPCPRLVLAMAQFQKGLREEAAKTLAEVVGSHDWCAANATTHDAWISHILRPEAEALILSNQNNTSTFVP